jgi:hypothetical protein
VSDDPSASAPHPSDPLPNLPAHDPTMDPSAGAGTPGTGTTDTGTTDTGTTDAGTGTSGIHFDHEPLNSGTGPPDVMTAQAPDMDTTHAGLADEFDTVTAVPAAMGGADALGMVADPAPTPSATEPAAPDTTAPAAPMFEDDLLGTHAMAQATAEAPPMPAFEPAPAPEVAMPAPDVAPVETAPVHEMPPAHEVMAAPEPPPEEHHDFAPIEPPHTDDSNDQD